MTELKNNSSISQIRIADEVISVIAGTSAFEVDGVAGASGIFKNDITEIIGKKNLAKGVKVSVADGIATIDITITVKMGYKIPEVCENVQAKVKTSVETMTGLTVGQVNILVTGLSHEKDTTKADKA